MVSKIPVKRPYKLPLESNDWGGAFFPGLNTSYLSMGTPVSLNIFQSNFTMIATIKPINILNTDFRFMFGICGFHSGLSINTNNRYGSDIWDTITGDQAVRESQGSAARDKISHVCMTYNTTSDLEILYVDGKLIGSKTVANPRNLYVDCNQGWFVGESNSSDGGNLYSTNMIAYDAIAIADTLTQPQIQDLMYGRILPTQFDCRLWHDYRLGHSRDLSGNSNHGVVNGNVRFV